MFWLYCILYLHDNMSRVSVVTTDQFLSSGNHLWPLQQQPGPGLVIPSRWKYLELEPHRGRGEGQYKSYTHSVTRDQSVTSSPALSP